jgi:hypothetical protein
MAHEQLLSPPATVSVNTKEKSNPLQAAFAPVVSLDGSLRV